MNRWARVAVLFGGGALVALGANLARPGTSWSALALIGGAIAAGELIEMRPPLRAALPISFAYMVVLARRATIAEATVVLFVAMLATFLVRTEPTSVEGRLGLFLERMLEGLAAVLVFRGIDRALDSPTDRGGVLFALGCAALAPLVVAEIARMVRERTLQITMQGRTADLALVTSATLMGISDLGVAGSGGMGLWGPLVFTIPLLAAAYSYEHLGEIRRTYDQTIRALGAAPELGGIVRDGHSEPRRVAVGVDRDRAGLLAPRARAARDGGAAAPPRSGVPRRARRRASPGADGRRRVRRADLAQHPVARTGG